jgi:hypothetical protein
MVNITEHKLAKNIKLIVFKGPIFLYNFSPTAHPKNNNKYGNKALKKSIVATLFRKKAGRASGKSKAMKAKFKLIPLLIPTINIRVPEAKTTKFKNN